MYLLLLKLSFASAILHLFYFSLHFCTASAGGVPTLPYNYTLPKDRPRWKNPRWLDGHVHFGSNSGPMARWLQNQKAAKDGIAYLLRFLNNTNDRIEKIRKNANAEGATSDIRGLYCNITKEEALYYGAKLRASFLGYGKLPEKNACITELQDDFTEEPMLAIKSFTDGVNNVAKNISSEFRRLPPYSSPDPRFEYGNWAHAEANSRFTYNTTYQQCTMEHAVGYRVDGYWNLFAGITNEPSFAQMPNWKRHYITEALVFRPGPGRKLASFPMNVQFNVSGVIQNVSMTTLYSTWGGRPQASYFGFVPVDRTNAIVDAMSRSAATREQVKDATTPSSILINVLQLFVALIPIGLFADVNARVTLGYAIATDFMGAMPLAVKGIELLKFSADKHLVTRTFIFGMENSSALAVGEIWAAKCETKGDIRNQGLVFLLVALSAMFIGFTLEILAYKKVKSNKAKRKAYLGALWHASRTQNDYTWTRHVSPCESCLCHLRDVEIGLLQDGRRHANVSGGLFSDLERRWRGG